MDENLVKILVAIIALLAAATVVITLKWINKRKKSITKTKQSGNIVGGDQAGRDINKT